MRGKNDRIASLIKINSFESKYAYLQSNYFLKLLNIFFLGLDGVKQDEKLKFWLLTPIFERIVLFFFF